MQICFATNNLYKLQEIRPMLGEGFEILSLSDIGCRDELPESQSTIEGNSLEKASFVYNQYGIDCFADDTGLEVYDLDGAPGVLSARYAGTDASDEDNVELLLQNLKNQKNPQAQFKTIITLMADGNDQQFEGIIKGHVIDQRRGSHGFGYDPVFVPEGFDKTFAEMELQQKNAISHRAKATAKLVQFLRRLE